jgi:DNA-binding CsgD family transcriptional regulator
MYGEQVMQTVFHQLSRMIDTVDDSRFDRCLFEFFDEQVSVAQCTVFLLPDGGAPCVVTAEGRNKDLNDSAKSLAKDYISVSEASDPNIGLYRERAKDECPEWQHYTAHAKDDFAYREKYYDQPCLRSDITLATDTEQGVLVTSLYRTRSEPDFSQADRQIILPLVPVYLSLMKQHLRVSAPRALPVRRVREERKAQLAKLLCTTSLSSREAEICSMIVLGYTTHGISLHLAISENTVATHRKRAYAKLGIASQNELFQFCLEAA